MKTAFLIVLTLLSWSSVQTKKHFVCYWESWSRYRAAPYTGTVSDIPVHLCTHLIYSFAGLDPNTWKVMSLEPHWDLDQKGFQQLVALKKKNPDLKVSFAVGGWNEGAKKYSDMVSKHDRIKTFVRSVVDWIKTYGFDGFDLDWEYPADTGRGGSAQDKQNLVPLLKALRESLGDKLLTLAVCTPADKISAGYDVPKIVKYVDFIHVMTYDLRGAWDNILGNHVSLYPSSKDKGNFAKLTVSQGMKNWVNAGAPKSKLIMGLAFYGKSFTMRSPSDNKQGAPSGGPGVPGRISQAGGTLFYFEICEKLKEGWTRVFDKETKTPYAFSKNQWVGYDDVEGITHKVDLVNRENYAGVMVWAIGLDDPANRCGQGSYPLSNAALKALGREPAQVNEIDVEPTPSESDPPTTETQPDWERDSRSPSALEPGPVGDCSSGVPYLPHSSQCSKFIQCVHGRPYEMSCPNGLVFDVANSVCNWPGSVEAKLPAGCTDA